MKINKVGKFLVVPLMAAVMMVCGVSGTLPFAETNNGILSSIETHATTRPTHSPTPHYFRKCSSNQTSIVDALKSIKANSSYSYRQVIASINGISNYRGSASQNIQLLNMLKQGRLVEYYISCR